MKLLKGAEATKLLNQPEFLIQWKTLQNLCPWKSAFQGPDFIKCWYQSYAFATPILICEYAKSGDLVGLFPLVLLESKRIEYAGLHQAEYQAWLASPECPITFLDEMTKMLIEHKLLRSFLKFKYLIKHPAMEPFLAAIKKELVIFFEYERPLIHLDSKKIEASFKKKSNKSRFNRLKKHGELTFKRITEKADLIQVFDLIIAQYDFRQGATNNSFPFFSDPNKKDFHLEWFVQNPDDFYISVMMIDNQLVSALIGVINSKSVSVAIIAHSPLFAANSPGKLHIMMLSKKLMTDGFEYLDLTPGGDKWKSRFADSFDKVYEYRIYAKKSLREQYIIQEKLITRFKKVFEKIGISPNQLRNTLAKVKGLSLTTIFQKLKSLLPRRIEMRFYSLDIQSFEVGEVKRKFNLNNFSDFIYFKPRQNWQTKQNVTSEALARLEKGESCYTYLRDDQLAHFGWLSLNQKISKVSEVKQEYKMPEGCAVLYDFYTDNDFRGKGLYQSAIKCMLKDLKSVKNIKYVYISVLADNVASRHVIEKLGFVYQESLVSAKVFGKFKPIYTQQQQTELKNE